MSETNSESAELVTTLTVSILIDRKDILLDVFRNEDIAKGVSVSRAHVNPRSVNGLNETTFLGTYSSGTLVDDIGSATEKINKWLGKPVFITCDEVTAAQLPKVNAHVNLTTRVKFAISNTGLDEMRND